MNKSSIFFFLTSPNLLTIFKGAIKNYNHPALSNMSESRTFDILLLTITVRP